MSLETLLPLIKKSGSSLNPEEFHRTINVVFHDFEASQYDKLHLQMWESLGEQVNLLVEDVFENASQLGDNLRMLDIGCGTGLSSQLLLASPAGKHITHVTLLDTSAKMLEQAKEKAKKWGKEVSAFEGQTEVLGGTFDIIMISSVLHHIPDIAAFMTEVNRLLNPGGILIHMQDPGGDHANDKALLGRLQEYRQTIKTKRPENGLVTNLKKIVKRVIGRHSYIDKVNMELIARGAIKKHLKADEIWSVTDIHVGDLPYSIGKGISLIELKKLMPDFTLISSRSYAFFGYLKSELPEPFASREAQYIDDKRQDGLYFAAVWQKGQA